MGEERERGLGGGERGREVPVEEWGDVVGVRTVLEEGVEPVLGGFEEVGGLLGWGGS